MRPKAFLTFVSVSEITFISYGVRSSKDLVVRHSLWATLVVLDFVVDCPVTVYCSRHRTELISVLDAVILLVSSMGCHLKRY